MQSGFLMNTTVACSALQEAHFFWPEALGDAVSKWRGYTHQYLQRQTLLHGVESGVWVGVMVGFTTVYLLTLGDILLPIRQPPQPSRFLRDIPELGVQSFTDFVGGSVDFW